MNKSMDEAYTLFENMALNYYQWSNERAIQKKVPQNYDVDALDIITAKVNALTQNFDRMNVDAVGFLNVSCKIYDVLDIN